MLALHGAGAVSCRPAVSVILARGAIPVHKTLLSFAGVRITSTADRKVQVRSGRQSLCCLAGRKDGQPAQKMNVAVIGAGAAGLVAARELLLEGHSVRVLEASHSLGGVWVLDPETESDPLGVAPGRRLVHSSMYESLRTNLPREVMSYLDVPFIPEAMDGRSLDGRRFCGHAEVLAYLEVYASRYALNDVISFGREVLTVRPIMDAASDGDSPSTCTGWDVIHQRWGDSEGGALTERFDALVVANGHYSLPNIPDPPIPGSSAWPGLQMHAHNYRNPSPFKGKVVVVVGAQSSGEDISREVASVAERVYLCARKWQNPDWAKDQHPYGPRENMLRRNNLCQLHEDGSVEFEGGMSAAGVDVVLYCTGYRYNFPFLNDKGIISLANGRVEPLYEQLFVPKMAPRLSFIGLPFNIVAFHLFHMQAKWLARALSGRSPLPADIEEQTEAFYRACEENNLPGRYAHEMRDTQWAYINRLADFCGDVPHLPEWRRNMYLANSKNKRADPEVYRDHQDDGELVKQAGEEFRRWLQEEGAARESALASGQPQG